MIGEEGCRPEKRPVGTDAGGRKGSAATMYGSFCADGEKEEEEGDGEGIVRSYGVCDIDCSYSSYLQQQQPSPGARSLGLRCIDTQHGPYWVAVPRDQQQQDPVLVSVSAEPRARHPHLNVRCVDSEQGRYLLSAASSPPLLVTASVTRVASARRPSPAPSPPVEFWPEGPPLPGPPTTIMSLTSRLQVNVLPGVERYRLLREINSGYFGRVYCGVDVNTKIQYAIKVVERAKLSQRQVENVQTEARILGMLDDKNIVALHEYIVTPQYFVLVMELMKGGDLFDRISEKVRARNGARTKTDMCA